MSKISSKRILNLFQNVKSERSFESIFGEFDEQAVDLLSKLLEFDPSKRLSAEEALQHPFMNKIGCK